MEKNFSKAQQEAKAYVENHGLEKLIGDMLNALVYAKDPCPPIFMIKYLANLVSSDDLAAKDIHIGSYPSPSSVYLEKVENVVKEESFRASESEYVKNSELKRVTEEENFKVESFKQTDVPEHAVDSYIEEEAAKAFVMKTEPNSEFKNDRPIETSPEVIEIPPLEPLKSPTEVRENFESVDAEINPPTESFIDPPVENKIAPIEGVKTDLTVEATLDPPVEHLTDISKEIKVSPPIVSNEETKIKAVEELKSNTDTPTAPEIPPVEDKIDISKEIKVSPPIVNNEETKIEAVEELKSNTDTPTDPEIQPEVKAPELAEVVVSENPPPA